MSQLGVCGLTSSMAVTGIIYKAWVHYSAQLFILFSLGEFTPVCCIAGRWKEYLNLLFKRVLHFHRHLTVSFFCFCFFPNTPVCIGAGRHSVIAPYGPTEWELVHPSFLSKRNVRRKHTHTHTSLGSFSFFFLIKSYLKRWMWPKFYTIENKVKQTACV